MADLDAAAAKLDQNLEGSLFAVLEDFNAPKATRDAASRILDQKLNAQLQAAIDTFQAGSMKLVDLVDQLNIAVDGLKDNVPTFGATAELPKLLNQARELLSGLHDREAMRSTHDTLQDAAATHPDEQMLPPLTPPAGDTPPKVTPINETGPVLETPVPVNSTRYEDLSDEYVRFFAGTEIRNTSAVSQNASKWLLFKPRYEQVGNPLGIPWWFIAATHMLEATFNFGTHLHNGDSLARRTVRVPPGRPEVWNPPNDWESSARDALSNLKGLKDWSLPRALFRWEAYNGFGYRPRGIATPYLWSMSSLYRRGKFVDDGVFNSNALSDQCGAASVLKFLHHRGDIALTLDRMSEGEPAPPPATSAAVEAAKATGRATIDEKPPVSPDFDTFLKGKVPDLRNFSSNEFLMMGGGNDNSLPPRELWPNVVPLVRVLITLRERLGCAMVLTSVYRNEAHNAAVGGVQGSQHSRFCASDFQAAEGNPQKWAAVLHQMRDGEKLFQGGIGLYTDFVHVDTRGWNADWTG